MWVENGRDISKIFEGIPSGCWVTLSHDEKCVLGYSPDFDSAVRMAREKGEDAPIITRVPPSDSGMLFL
jgi:hypothetical protein